MKGKIILLLILIGAFLIILTQKYSNSFNNWKTYTFSKIGFSLQLPSEWILHSDQDLNQATVESKVVNDQDPTGQYYKTEILTGPNIEMGPTSQTNLIKAYFAYNGLLGEADYLEGKGDNSDEVKYSKIKIPDSDKEFVYSDAGNLIEAFIPIKEIKGEQYALILSIEKRENKKTFDKILSTFRFTSP